MTVLLWSLMISSIAAKPASGVVLKVTLQEAVIIQTLLEQVSLSTEEVGAFLAIQQPLEALISQQPAGTSAEQKLTLRLPEQSAQDLLVFMQRLTIKGGGAQQVNKILDQLSKRVGKDSPYREQPQASPQKIKFSLTPEEALLVQQQLLRIEVAIPEIPAFLALYNPLEKALRDLREEKALEISLSAQGPQNLLIFMQRFEIVGSQVKLVQGLLERIAQAQS